MTFPYSIEAAVNGHSFTVSGPDAEWVERVAKETFASTKPDRNDRRQTGFQAASPITAERQEPLFPSGWIGYGGPSVDVER